MTQNMLDDIIQEEVRFQTLGYVKPCTYDEAI